MGRRRWLLAWVLCIGCGDDESASGKEGEGEGAGEGEAEAEAEGEGEAEAEGEGGIIKPPNPKREKPPADVCAEDTSLEETLYLSADDSNSQASPVIARANLYGLSELGWLRTYEFLNYYTFDYEPADGGSLRVVPQLRAIDGDPSAYTLQIGVQSAAESLANRRNFNLTFVLDNSGSMEGEPIELERQVLYAIASILHEGDVVSMVTWNTANTVVLDSHGVSGSDDEVLLSAIAELDSGGGTDLNGGLEAGYELATGNYDEEMLNRVILISDGQANAGITAVDLIAASADDAENEGIYLVGVGVGTGYNDTLMDEVTDAGKGAYLFVDTADEAWLQFGGERVLANLELAAMDVQLELALPPDVRMEEFYGEEYSKDPKEVEPQHLGPNDAMLFFQTLRACASGVEDSTIEIIAHYVDPETREEQSSSWTGTIADLLAGENEQLRKGAAIVAYAELLKSGDQTSKQCDLINALVAAEATALGDSELADIAAALDEYCD